MRRQLLVLLQLFDGTVGYAVRGVVNAARAVDAVGSAAIEDLQRIDADGNTHAVVAAWLAAFVG